MPRNRAEAQPLRKCGGCVHEIFRGQAANSPRGVAVRHSGTILTYGELDARSNGIAHALLARGVRRGDLVGLHGLRSAQYIAAMLGVLKAGAAYLPLDPALPQERLEFMARDAAPVLVLTLGQLVAPWSPVPVHALSRTALPDRPDAPPVDSHPDDLMYVPYTSGSTGQPKGVAVPHRSLPGLYGPVPFAPWGPGHSVLHHSSLSWDGHAAEIFAALLHGGTVEVFPGDAGDPFAVLEYARATGVSLLLLPTQAFNTAAAADPRALAGPDCLVIAGEAASPEHVARAMEAVPGLRVVNAYGPVECTAAVTVHEIQPEDLHGPIPIGRPVGDREVYILDEMTLPAADHAEGLVYVGGQAVAHGYLGRAALTAERFVPDPYSGRAGARLYATGDRARQRPDGLLEFLGRADEQIKLRGFRIEPGEVEAALRRHPSVLDACVVSCGSAETARLAGFIVPLDERHAACDPAKIRAWLSGLLPAPMVPSRVMVLERFPVTSSGKVDRAALRQACDPAEPASRGQVLSGGPGMPPDRADKQRDDGAGEHADLQARLAVIWGRYLNLSPGDIRGTDNFFELGGQSLAASRVALQIRRDLGVEMQARDVFDVPVLLALTHLVRERSGPTEARKA